MRIEAKAFLLSFLLGGLLPVAGSAQHIITDLPTPPASRESAPPSAADSAPAAKLSRPSGTPHRQLARRSHPLAPRLLDKDEGLKVIAAAMGSHIRHASEDDCSRLVHDIYERAGFPYAFGTSRDLYAGNDAFHRTWAPQPGDLIVWPGHVGIVVSPREHLFFSKLTSSGQDIASYDAPYWRERGQPRFFRYLKPDTSRTVVAAADTRPPAGATVKTPPAASPARDTSASSEDASLSTDATRKQAESLTSEVMLSSPRPRPAQVRQAVLQQLSQRASALGSLPDPDVPAALIVFDDLRVERVRLGLNQGWAEVRIHQLGSVIGGRANLGARERRVIWSLRRSDRQTWQIAGPGEVGYLPREVAVPVIAHRLASLADSRDETGAENNPQAQSLVRLLSLLTQP